MTPSMQTVATRELVENFVEALLQRNLEKIVSLFSDKVDWYIPGPEALAPWLGKRNSRKQVEDFFRQLWQQTEPISGKLDPIFAEDTFAVITGSFSVRMLQTHKIFESLFFIQIAVENGLIVRYRLLEEGYGLSIALKA